MSDRRSGDIRNAERPTVWVGTYAEKPSIRGTVHPLCLEIIGGRRGPADWIGLLGDIDGLDADGLERNMQCK